VFNNIGFMQGRLSPIVDGKIQAFPLAHWREEFSAAETLGITLMEWTLDHEGLYNNPLINSDGRSEVLHLCKQHGIEIPSITGDCFMQAPFYKATELKRQELLAELDAVLTALGDIGGGQVVIPLVDNGSLDTPDQGQVLFNVLQERNSLLRENKIIITFEVDLAPKLAAEFISTYPSDCFGINYDIGNSAALGYDPHEEFAAYGERITNVHVKDRLRGGTTVPLGEGAADFNAVFKELARQNYSGNYILQTARAKHNDHSIVLARYAQMTTDWIKAAR